MSAFGGQLLRHRRAAGLTQEGLAEASGVSVRALRDLERGRAHAAQRRTAEIIADALRLTGQDRREFLDAARQGRRRVSRSPALTALSELSIDVPVLIGRDQELAQLREIAVAGATVVIVGHPGVGKTALAVFAANRMRQEFPDGCFAVNLRGMDNQPMASRAVLHRLLRELGVPGRDIPPTDAEQANLYRTVMAGKRVLVLLDNASDEAQVRPLLPGAPGCLTLVTCRRTLAGLAAARWLWLEPFADNAAIELLTTIVGPARVSAELDAATELVTLCGQLPLAVRIAGDRLAAQPGWSLSHQVGQMRDERGRLSSLASGDVQVRSVFELSYLRLPATAREVLRRLAAVPGGDFDSELAAVASGVSEQEARHHLDELADASLLQVAPADGRFHFHDLIRLFVHERWEAEAPPAVRDRVLDGVLDHLLGTAAEAAAMYFPEQTGTGAFPSLADAGEWLAQEESNWLTAQRAAVDRGLHRQVLRLAEAMHWYSDTHWAELSWDEVFRHGLHSARALGDQTAEATMLNFLGWAETWCLGDGERGLATHRQALAIAVDAGVRREQAWAHGYIGTRLQSAGHLEEALEHVLAASTLSVEFEFWTMQVTVRNRLGRLLLALGRHDEALAVQQALVAEMTQRQDQDDEASTRRHVMAVIKTFLSDCLRAVEQWRPAAEIAGEARRVLVEVGAKGYAASAYLSEGTARLALGEHDRARDCLQRALALFDELGMRDNHAAALAQLARLPVR
ncbi:XRE family transcriptional regulator [Actinophytocola sediminis]